MFKRKQASIKGNEQKKCKTDDELWKLIFQDAQNAYKQNKFEDAVSLFSRALMIQPDHLSILDGRSLCFERLNNFADAMNDAKQLIKTCPTDARGYLRAGKILSLQKRFMGANKTYDCGLEKVNLKDKRYQLLLNMKKTVERLVAGRLDFMSILPYDVKALIFSYMPFTRRLRCMAVSKIWRNFTLQWGGMWRDLDFMDVKINYRIFERCLNYTDGRHVRRLTLSNMEQTQMAKLFNLMILKNCPYMDTIELKTCHISRDMLLKTLNATGKHLICLKMNDCWGISLLDVFFDILKLCHELKDFSVIKLHPLTEEEELSETIERREVFKSKLETLRISFDSTGSQNCLLKLLQYFPQLRLLDIQIHELDLGLLYYNLQLYCPHLETLSLNIYHCTSQTTISLSKLHLRYFSIRTITLTSTRYLVPFLCSDRLETLILSNCSGAGPNLINIAVIPNALNNIRKLHFTSTLDLHTDDLSIILSSCVNLEDLKITGSQGVTDALIYSLSDSIKRIDFSQSTYLTGSGIQKLIKKQIGKLEKLVINNCSKIDYNVVGWAIEMLGKNVVECRHTINRR